MPVTFDRASKADVKSQDMVSRIGDDLVLTGYEV